jgi:MinD superfamily P-loop ATPase
MNEIVVCSGKGGTGKTSIVASLAALAENLVLADCDVDAANLHLVSNPEVECTTPFFAGHTASIRSRDCLACGTCHDLCRYSAILKTLDKTGNPAFRVDPLLCEGCGVCVRFCPTEAIDFPGRQCGQWFRSRTSLGPMFHAALHVGAENSGKLVTRVREQARIFAERSGLDLILVDGPPGIGCPVTAALTGADLTLLVTEPSLSGLHDLKRICELAAHFQVPAMVCVNKHDLCLEMTENIEKFCREKRLPLVGKIPYEPKIDQAQMAGRSLVEYAPNNDAARVMTSIWLHLERQIAICSQRKDDS